MRLADGERITLRPCFFQEVKDVVSPTTDRESLDFTRIHSGDVAPRIERRIRDMPLDIPLVDQNDEDLLVLAREDPFAFDELYRRHVTRTVTFAARRCATPEQVHDLVAGLWLEVIGAVERFDPAKGKALPWILGIAANLAADARRRAAREHEALRRLDGRRVLDEDDVARLEARIDAAQRAATVLGRIQGLPLSERVAIELVALEGLSDTQAAASLAIEPAALRMRLARARKKLAAEDLAETGRVATT